MLLILEGVIVISTLICAGFGHMVEYGNDNNLIKINNSLERTEIRQG